MSQIVTSLIGALLNGHLGQTATTIAKSEIGANYVSVVKNLKTLAVTLYMIAFLTSGALLGAFIFIYCLLGFLHATPETMNAILGLIGGGIFLFSIRVLFILRSDKFWLKITKIDEIVSDVVEQSPAIPPT